MEEFETEIAFGVSHGQWNAMLIESSTPVTITQISRKENFAVYTLYYLRQSTLFPVVTDVNAGS